MKKILSLFSALALLVCPALALAQSAAASPAPAVSAPIVAQQPGTVVQSADSVNGKPGAYIRHTDSGNTIEEVREGADTTSISVKPNNAAPQYQIVPDSRSGQPGRYGNQGGQRVWKVLSF